MGIYQGMKMLANEKETKTVIEKESGKPEDSITVSRIPAVVLLSDGQPTFSSSGSNWWEPTENEQGPGSAAYYGNGMLAMMTAAYMKDAVDRNYGVDNQPDADSRAKYATKIYTVGMGLNENGTTTADYLAQVTLNPAINLNSNNNAQAKAINEKWEDYRINKEDVKINVDRNKNYTLKHPSTHDISSDPNALKYNDEMCIRDRSYTIDLSVQDLSQLRVFGAVVVAYIR